MSAASIETPVYDRTARKAHQWSMVALVAAGLILQGTAGTLLVTVAAVIMLAGRFWWPADVVRQLVWRGLEPARVPQRGGRAWGSGAPTNAPGLGGPDVGV